MWRRTTSGDDGGAAYYPGNSPAGYVELPDGTRVPRSYGSMTYALLKTYTLAGVKGNDRRVHAAIEWIKRNWTLDENPGADPRKPAKLRYQGLYYAYMVLAQALTVAKLDTFEVSQGEGYAPKTIDWRKDLREKLTSLQNDDGSWINDKNGRWYEDLAVLCTIYAILALSQCPG